MKNQAQSSIETEMAQKYVEMLSHHFSRKVSVDKTLDASVVHFAMGQCRMSVANDKLCFHCSANTVEALNTVIEVIDRHIPLLKKIRDQKLEWVYLSE